MKCADCRRLESIYIPEWNEYVHRCGKFRTLRTRIDVNFECTYFERKAKKKQVSEKASAKGS